MRPRAPLHIWIVAALLCSTCAMHRLDGSEAMAIAEAMEVRPGMHVADVGAGDGEWTVDLARRVGSGGQVYATEVEEDDLDSVRDAVNDAGHGNVTFILGTQGSTGLPDRCCDAILLRQVYHHFTDPEVMMRDLARALRPGGRLLIIEIETQTSWSRLEGVPERDGHGILRETLAEELAGSGWTFVSEEVPWADDRDRYGVLLAPPEGDQAAP